MLDRAAHDGVIPLLPGTGRPGHHLAGVDPNSGIDPPFVRVARPDELAVADGQARPDRPLRVVLVGNGRTEDR